MCEEIFEIFMEFLLNFFIFNNFNSIFLVSSWEKKLTVIDWEKQLIMIRTTATPKVQHVKIG